MKIYSNKRDEAARENIGFWMNEGWRKIFFFFCGLRICMKSGSLLVLRQAVWLHLNREAHMNWREEERFLGWKTFWAENKYFGLKKGNASTEKKKGALNKSRKGALTRKKWRTRKKRRRNWKEKEALEKIKRGLKQKRDWKTRKADAKAGKGWRRFFCVHFFLQIILEKLWWIRLCWI